MDKVFIWDPENDQTFTAQYGTQNASLKDNYESFWKIPGKNFTMHEDTDGMALSLIPQNTMKMSFPWVRENDDDPLPCEINLKNGHLVLNYDYSALGSDVLFGVSAVLNLSLYNNARLSINNFASAIFGKYCVTQLKDVSSIDISFVKDNAQAQLADPGSIFILEGPVSLEDSSSMRLNCFSIYYAKTISCEGNSTLSLEALQHQAEFATFNISDSATITIVNKNESSAAFDFENKSYSPGLFNFVKKIDFDTYNPKVTFSATIFNQIIMNKLLSLGVIKTNYNKRKITFRHEGGNRYSIGPGL
ncbi:hypothetical protein [Enterobacter cloacae complex sp. ESBL7]|uniref:hypothetical protein n=1 Tax=Enterobacter cloacae complex sp. ESBL7 TaxID=3163325 RepID=UPI003564E1C5